MIQLSSVGIGALHQRSSCCSESSSIHLLVMQLSAHSQDGYDCKGMQNSMVTERAGEPETIPSVPWWEEQTDAIEVEVIVEYKLDIGYKPEGSDPENEPDAQEDEDNSNAEYAQMELPQ